jgi:hypothetical protein
LHESDKGGVPLANNNRNNQNNNSIVTKNKDNNYNTKNTLIPSNKQNKHFNVLDKIAEMEANSSPDGGFEIEAPRLFPPKPKHTVGSRQYVNVLLKEEIKVN